MDHGIVIEYRMPDGRIVRGTQVEGVEKILVLLYADDLVLICEDGEALAEIMRRIEESTQKWGLTINVKKTKRMVNKANVSPNEVDIEMRGERVERVEEFVYLGSLITNTGTVHKEIERRLQLGQYRFNELKKPIFDQETISRETKVNIYEAIVLPTILYGSETWTCTDKEYNRLNTVNNKMLRQIVGKKRDEIHNLELHKVTNTDPIDLYVKRQRLRWARHVRSMFGNLVGGKSVKVDH